MKYSVHITLKTQDEMHFDMSPESYMKLARQLVIGMNDLFIEARTGGAISCFHIPVINILYVQAMALKGTCKETKLVG